MIPSWLCPESLMISRRTLELKNLIGSQFRLQKRFFNCTANLFAHGLFDYTVPANSLERVLIIGFGLGEAYMSLDKLTNPGDFRSANSLWYLDSVRCKISRRCQPGCTAKFQDDAMNLSSLVYSLIAKGLPSNPGSPSPESALDCDYRMKTESHGPNSEVRRKGESAGRSKSI